MPFQYTTEPVELDKLVFGRPGAVKDELPVPKNTQKKNKIYDKFSLKNQVATNWNFKLCSCLAQNRS